MTTAEYIAKVRERLAKATPKQDPPAEAPYLPNKAVRTDLARLTLALERAVDSLKWYAGDLECEVALEALADIERILSGGGSEGGADRMA